MQLTTRAPNPRATGRNGDDFVWDVAHKALLEARWGVALEALRTMNAFYRAHAVDSMLSLGDLRSAKLALPPGGIARHLEAEISAWNAASMSRWR